MIPEAHFYLIKFESGEPVAIFSVDECRTANELHHLEARIRAEHRVDDVEAGLAFRNGGEAPLSVDVRISVMVKQRRRRSVGVR